MIGERKLLFWNIAEVRRQEVGFCKFICKWNFICWSKIWLEKKRWNKIKRRLPKLHSWSCCSARREKKKGRVKGDFISRKKNWGEGRRRRFTTRIRERSSGNKNKG